MMKGFLSFCFVFTAVWCSGQAVITTVFDASLPGGLPKGIEIYLTEDIADLSTLGLSSANNGGGTTDSAEFVFPAVAGAQGDFIIVASEETEFQAFFGFAPDYTDDAANINGDDAVELYSNGVVIDVFGEVDVDGSGQPWDYQDGWASRAPGSGPDGSSFTIANWTFSGVDALDDETMNSTAAMPIPLAAYAGGMVNPDHTVEVRSNVFDPDLLIVDVGDVVQWDNVQGFHNVNGTQATYTDNPSDFTSGAPAMAPWSYQYTFTVPGYHQYQCDPHVGLGMTGAVMVREVGDHYVAVENNLFEPRDITIDLGESVVWTNVSGFHNVNGSQATFPDNPEEFTSGAPSTNWTYKHTFTQPGVYEYQCDPHAGLDMIGTITVNSPYRVTSIATLRENDADGNAVYEDSLVAITGIVHGPDYRAGRSGVEFFVINGQNDGIVVWTNQDNDYVVTEGDEVEVLGRVSQFNGLTQLRPDQITVLSQGNNLNTPEEVDAPSEDTEGSFILISALSILDASEWPDEDNSANVRMTNSAGDTIIVRIDSDIDLNQMAPMTGQTLNVTGLGIQFDNSAPRTEGYQILPRSGDDIEMNVAIRNVEEVGVRSIYPNPASEFITLESDIMIEHVRLYDGAGRLIRQQPVYTYQIDIGVSDLPQSTYLLEVQTTNGVGVKRVLVRRP